MITPPKCKGGAGNQDCGWLLTEDILGGGVDDTDNNQRAGYIQAQAEFQSNVAVNGRITPFTIILDNRYPGRAAGWDNGYQIALQPPAAKSDRPVTAILENLSS